MREHMPIVLVILCWSFLAIVFLWIFAHAEHTEITQWTRGYASADGTSCCSLGTDCKEAPVRIMRIDGEVMTVEVDGEVVTLPSKSVHQSETMRSYYCLKFGTKPTTDSVRCLFWAIGT